MARRKNNKNRTRKQAPPKVQSSIAKTFQWIVASGLLVLILTTSYHFLSGDISLEFVKPLDSGYEFKLKNDTPSDDIVKKFRIIFPHQSVIVTTTRDVYATLDAHGHITLPGGNSSYVPASEFRELDGRLLPANSSINFRIPPLSSRSWMQPDAMIVQIAFQTTPKHDLLAYLNSALNVIGLHSKETTIRYLVVSNYWTVTQSSSTKEAIRIACRDNDSLAKLNICSGQQL